METITLAGGCFWCGEALFKRLKGVKSVTSGYANSNKESPAYEEVCTGETGAAEAIQVDFDPKEIPLEKILEIFFATHDPTTLNRQGDDIGTQYRSAVFYQTQEQKKVTGKLMKPDYVTEIASLKNFYPAEDYHKDYYDKNRSQPYCSLVIDPKVNELLKEYGKDIKEEYL